MKKIVLFVLSILLIATLCSCYAPSELAEIPTPTLTISPSLEPTFSPDTTLEPTAEPTPTPTPTPAQTTKPSPKPTVKPTAKTTATPSATKKPTVVQYADPETGISWDGKSPIIYTYPDGTTGTEKRDGAKYEQVPGIYTTYVAPRDPAGRLAGSICSTCGKIVGTNCTQKTKSEYCNWCGIFLQAYTCHDCPKGDIYYCRYCGKIGGDGTNGTCLRYWTGGDHICYSCGANVPVKTCHTCTSGCMYCKKPLGNGTNGTCYRDYFGSSKCPSCNASVPINTCHACE